MARSGWTASALAAVAILATLSGCTGGERAGDAPDARAPSPFGVAASGVEAGRAYLVQHAGGPLVVDVAAGGAVTLQLLDAEDVRVGEYRLGGGGAPSALRLEALPAGEYVLRTVNVTGRLSITSGGSAAVLWPLGGHVERHVLAMARRDAVPPVPFLPRDVVDKDLEIVLAHAPTSVRILSTGSFGELHLQLESAAGEVFRSDWDTGKFSNPFASGVEEVPGVFRAEAASGRVLRGHLFVTDLEGAIVLEARSESRALPPGQDRVGPAPGPAAHAYGRLPGVPVEVEVAAQATALVVWDARNARAAADDGPAWVAVFGPDDRRLAAVPVPAGGATQVDVPPGGGRYVVAPLRGNVTLGADAEPPSLGFRLLESTETVLPERAAGRDGEYGNATEPVSGPARSVLYDVRPTTLRDPYDFLDVPMPCPDSPSLRLVQGSETLAAWGFDGDGRGAAKAGAQDAPTGALLRDGEVELWQDGFGPSPCERPGIVALGYTR